MDGLYMPGAQDKHALIDMLPLDGLYLPAAQDKHALIDALPVDGLYVPAAQDKHSLIEVLAGRVVLARLTKRLHCFSFCY